MSEHRVNHSPIGAHDSRVGKLIQHQMQQNPLLNLLSITADPFNHRGRVGSKYAQARTSYGLVTQSIPFFGWYRVELDGQGGSIGCYRLQPNASPLGMNDFETILPGQRVLVDHWPGITVGCIRGVAPLSIYDAYAYRPGWLLQGAGTGVFRDAAHNQGLKLERNGGILDFSTGSPLDSLLLDTGKASALGMSFLLNPVMAHLRISEICGLWLNWIDKQTRLAGKTLEIWSPAEILSAFSDQTEPYLERAGIIYKWEGTGYLANVGDIGQVTSDHAVWYSELLGTYDRPKADVDVKPFARSIQWGGYVGQGGLETVQAPAPGATKNNANHKPIGLSSFSRSLDGDAFLQGAHAVGMVKDIIQSQPHRIRSAADRQGDNAKGTSPNYRAAGIGTGTPHDIQGSVDDDSFAIDDELCYLAGWKPTHAFYYHKKDYYLQQPSESPFGRSQDRVDYSPIQAGRSMSRPQPVQLNIDHRYGGVNYYRRKSFMLLRPDGDISCGDGNGVSFGTRNGKFFIHAPDGIEIMTGGRNVIMGGELCINMHQSIDMVAANGDLRLASTEGNMQMIGQSVLIESTDTSNSYNFDGQVGADVTSTGIVFKSATGVVTWSDTVYMRSGVGNQKRGDIIIDAAERKNSVVINSRQCSMYTDSGLNIWSGNPEQETFDLLHSFGKLSSTIGTKLVINGSVSMTGEENDLLLDGSIDATGSIACAGGMANKSGAVGKVPDDYADRLNASISKIEEQLESILTIGQTVFDAVFTNGYYSENRPGNKDLIEDAGFSFRDDDESVQYGSSDLVFEEPRWQRWLRLGLATGGSTWTQKPLSYQGKELYPYPGRKAWTENTTFNQVDASGMMDFENGRQADRTDQTGKTEPGQQNRVKLLGNLKVMIG